MGAVLECGLMKNPHSLKKIDGDAQWRALADRYFKIYREALAAQDIVDAIREHVYKAALEAPGLPGDQDSWTASDSKIFGEALLRAAIEVGGLEYKNAESFSNSAWLAYDKLVMEILDTSATSHYALGIKALVADGGDRRAVPKNRC
jgi:hypothetical protein